MDFNDHVAELTLAYQQELRSIATRKERGSSNAQMLQQELIEALNEVETCVTAGQTQIREEKQRQLQLREQNSQLLRESLAKLQQDFRVAINEQYEREERALLAEERKYEQMELEALAEQNQALTIAALQNAFPTKIAFQQLLEHTPDYRHIAATFQTQQRGDAGSQDGREVHILQIYRCFHEDLTAAFEAHTKEMESSDGLSSTEGSELYLYLVADDDQVISLLQNGLVSATSSVDSIDSIASWVFLFSNPVVALQFYKGTIGELEVLEESETEADSHEKRPVSGTSSGLEGGQASLVPEQSLPAVETFNLLLCQVRLQHTIELFRPETVRLDSLEALHSIARPRGAVLQPPPSSFLQLEVGGRDSWSASPSGGHVYMARRDAIQAQVVPQFVLLCSKRDGSTGDPGSGNNGNSVDDELGALTSDALLSRFQQQLRSEVDAYHSRLYREVDPATVRVRAQFLQEQEQLQSRLQDTEGQIGQEKREQECILRALRGGSGGRVSGVERGVAKRG
ncbi:hypothetical protein BBJ28_00016766 [Nothophytophthora sp. Chile5]|nr:hypothetical protein BBJ28_00016766 [Nothophytophthora sp. Chile5]